MIYLHKLSKIQEMVDSVIYAKYVIIFLGSLAKAGAVIEFTKLHGKVIPESIFRTTKDKPKHIR